MRHTVVTLEGQNSVHVVIEPEGAPDPAGESDARDVPVDSGTAAGEQATGPAVRVRVL